MQLAGDFDYERGGSGYALQRRTDPRIAAAVHAALGTASTVLNVGAGAGSYEPADRAVTAVEPSAAMRAQRPAGLAPAIEAVAEQLPFADNTFDAAMATITIHQWRDAERGLHELRRVSRGPVVILTFDGPTLSRFWLADYAPEMFEVELRRFPAVPWIMRVLGPACTLTPVPIPIDCLDGFGEAYYARPEYFLDSRVREAQSSWGFVDELTSDRAVEHLRADLASGEWDRRYGQLRVQPEYFGSLRLIVSS